MKRNMGWLVVWVGMSGCMSDTRTLAPMAPDQPWRQEEKVESQKTGFALPREAAAPAPHPHNPIDPKRRYTLPELIDLAQKNNPDTRIAWETSKQAAAAVGLAQSAYLPELSAQVLGGFERTPLPIPKDLKPKGYFTAHTKELLPSLVIKWLLFDFGRRDAQVEGARALSTASNAAFTGKHQKLIFEVSKAYFVLDATHAQLDVAERALKNAKLLQEAASDKAKQGLATTVEVAIAAREVAQAQLDLEHARANDREAYYALMETLGLNPTLRIQVESARGSDLPKGLERDVDTYITRALSQRPDVAAAYANVRASEAGVKGARAAYYPTLGAEAALSQNMGTVKIDSGPSFHVNKPASAILFRVSMPLYDGGLRSYAMRIARSKKKEAKAELEKAQDQAIHQVAQAYDAFKSALASYQAARALVKASDTAARAALDAYHQGVGTFTDSMTSQTKSTQAHAAQVHAHAMVLTSAAALAFATGDLTSIAALDS
ncbi:MAG: TolC family protein [Candidatus Puniceispirillum sp.]|nr:TolC family protein [Candidatus Puniceispirillum sp.]